MKSIIALALAMVLAAGMSSFALAAGNAQGLNAAIPNDRAQPAAPAWKPKLKKTNPANNSAAKSVSRNTLVGFGHNKQRRYGHRRHVHSATFSHRGYGHYRHNYHDLSSYWGISFSKHRKYGRSSKHRKFGLFLYGSLGHFRYQLH